MSDAPASDAAPWWRRAPSPRLVLPMAAAAIGLLLGIVALAGWSADQQAARSQKVRHTFTVEQHITDLLLRVQDAETGQRGYLLTAQADYLEPYRAALPMIAAEQRALKSLMADNAAQVANLTALDAAVAVKLAELAATIDLVEKGDRGAALRVVRANSGKVAMDRVRTIVASMRAEENRLLKARLTQSAQAGAQLRTVILGAAIAILLLGLLIVASLRAYGSALARVNADLRAEIDARRAAEDQIVQIQKMELIGQLAGGIAHDFNNMLAVVVGALNILQRRIARGEREVAPMVEAALDGARRAATLTTRLLAFSRQQPLSPEPLDANRMVAGMSDMLHRTLGENIQIETVTAAGLWRIRADPSQVENSILNLAVNARDAMPDGGRLTIETANCHLDDAYVASHFDVPPGQYVLIAISDTGPGMTPAVMAKAFDPFFTTKPVGKGTGLGLSQVHGFVKQSGGHIRIYSEQGHGTVVKIYLPRFVGDLEHAAPHAPHVAGQVDPATVILVVEDEEHVRRVSVASLRELGYTVLHASRPSEALDILRDKPRIDLLFTDVVMPEMSGRKLADLALAERPDLKVLFTTGYTQNAVVHNGILDPGTDLLMKPFGIDDLAGKVAGVLARA